MIHFRSCHFYRRAHNVRLPLTVKVKIRFCRYCCPDPEDVAADPPEVRWFEWGPYGGSPKQVDIDLDYAEKLAARRDLGIGRRNTTGRRWEG